MTWRRTSIYQKVPALVARLCVEEPTGAIICLSLGSIRCRFRNSASTPEPLSPGDPTSVGVRLGQTAYAFPSGSRIVVTLTSSDFSRILPHPNHMGYLFEGEVLIAQTQNLHGSSFSSRLELPVIDDV